jgi:pimeloyl-ACP methyl ester carboxylesterase
VGLELMARGDAAVAAQVAARVEKGTLTDALPPLSDVPMVGVGHSMGACLTTMVEAEDRPFSAIALLGYSVDITNVHADQPTDADLNAAIDETEAIVRQNSEALQDGTSTIVPREPLHGLFHASDVPPSLIAADDAVQSRVPIRAVAQVTTPGFVGRYASKVDVPVLLAFGDVDVAPDPRIEAAHFPACRDITLVVVEGSAHCHNFSSGRITLWERLGAWLETV